MKARVLTNPRRCFSRNQFPKVRPFVISRKAAEPKCELANHQDQKMQLSMQETAFSKNLIGLPGIENRTIKQKNSLKIKSLLNPETASQKSLRTKINKSVIDNKIYSSNHPVLQKQNANSNSNSLHKDESIVPNYKQHGNSCAATSLITSLLIWDRENQVRDPKNKNTVIEKASNLILISFYSKKTEILKWLSSRLIKGKSGDAGKVYRGLEKNITQIRDKVSKPGGKISQSDYQLLGYVLYMIGGGKGGLSISASQKLANILGLSSKAHPAQTYDDIYQASILKNLKPGEHCQVSWVTRGGVAHAFLIGRTERGSWFLSDQGVGKKYIASSLSGLKTVVDQAIESKEYWLSKKASPLLGGFSGVTFLGNRKGVERKFESLVSKNKFLAEVDSSILIKGDRMFAKGYVGHSYSFRKALSIVNSGKLTGFSALIIEMPKGTYSVYRASPVKAGNFDVKKIDESDSKGGLLTTHTFLHTWLSFGNSTGKRSTSVLQVY